MNYQEKIKQLEAELKALKEKYENKLWKPATDETFYFIKASGLIEESRYADTDLDSDKEITGLDSDKVIIGNYFNTREEAEKALEKLTLLEQIKQWRIKNDPASFYLDWSSNESEKVELVYNNSVQAFTVNVRLSIQNLNGIYFSHVSNAELALKHFGDRLKLLLN
jgi:hypothetical protein